MVVPFNAPTMVTLRGDDGAKSPAHLEPVRGGHLSRLPDGRQVFLPPDDLYRLFESQVLTL